ncbi:M24 family metallopeptidase [Mycolicibacterium sp. CBM1]
MLARRIPREELGQRRAEAVAQAKSRGLDALLVWGRGGPAVDFYGDILYLTNHFPAISSAEPDTELWSGRSYSALILPVDGDPVLIVDLPEYDEDSVDIADVRPSMNVAVGVAEALKGLGLHDRRIGLVGHHVFLASHQRMMFNALGREVAWIMADDILTGLRAVKSDAELDLIREAAQVGVGWMSAMLDAAVPGATEGQVAGAGLAYLAEHGGIPADLDIASGPHGNKLKSHWALPSWDFERPMAAGDIFHVDAWGSIGGYFTDTARTTVVGGTPSADQLRVIDGTIALVEHLVSAIRPGLRCRDIYELGTAWMRENGFADQLADDGATLDTHVKHAAMWPYFGHGIGLGLEAPWLTGESDIVIVKNMTFAVEVYFNAPNGDLVGFEQNIIVTDDAAENMTAGLRKKWWE